MIDANTDGLCATLGASRWANANDDRSKCLAAGRSRGRNRRSAEQPDACRSRHIFDVGFGIDNALHAGRQKRRVGGAF
jgi:hypothetical protein